jgi:hypothetical protein
MVKMGEHFAKQPSDVLVIHSVEYLVGSPARLHQAQAAQASQVMRDRRGGHSGDFSQGINALLALSERKHDPGPGRVAKGGEVLSDERGLFWS